MAKTASGWNYFKTQYHSYKRFNTRFTFPHPAKCKFAEWLHISIHTAAGMFGFISIPEGDLKRTSRLHMKVSF